MSGWFFGVFPFCIPLVYSLGASCSFLIHILLFTDKKKKRMLSKKHTVSKLSPIAIRYVFLGCSVFFFFFDR